MNYADVNHLIWNAVHWLGWWWWGSVVALALINLLFMYSLDAPVSLGARVARVFAFLACILACFTPWFNSLGTVAYPCLFLSYAILNGQFVAEARQRRQRFPSFYQKPETRSGRVVAAMVGHGVHRR